MRARRAKLDQLEEMEAQLTEMRAHMERMQRDYEERLQGSGAELRRLMLEKTLLQARQLSAFLGACHRPLLLL